MAKYDYGGGCPCGLFKECEPDCIDNPQKTLENYLRTHVIPLQTARRNIKILKLLKEKRCRD